MRDLRKDLEICKKATPDLWESDRCGSVFTESFGEKFSIADCYYVDDDIFIAESRTGWPEAIKLALAAEKEVYRLKKQIEILEAYIEEIRED